MENPPPLAYQMETPEPNENYLNFKPCIVTQINNYN